MVAQIPGLKVVMPTMLEDAKVLLPSSIFDEDPVIFLEHRRRHYLEGEVPTGDHRVPIGSAACCARAAMRWWSRCLDEYRALHAVDHLVRQAVHGDLIDLRTVRPIDSPTIEASVRRTGRLLVLDNGYQTGGVSGEIVARVAGSRWKYLRTAPQRLAMPDVLEVISQP